MFECQCGKPNIFKCIDLNECVIVKQMCAFAYLKKAFC